MGADPIDPFRVSTPETRAGYDWWSLRPVATDEVPLEPAGSSRRDKPGGSTAARTPIDAFLLAKLHTKA
ncbi:MAG: hypothetical protein U0797_20160 [Gemmataceae bacterium]